VANPVEPRRAPDPTGARGLRGAAPAAPRGWKALRSIGDNGSVSVTSSTADGPADGPLRLLCVHAHPDDESSKGAATMARYVDEGVQVLVVSCTGGERGDILNPALKGRTEIEGRIREVRRQEMNRAAAILGVQHRWLGYVDSGLPEGDPLPPLPAGCFGLVPVQEAARALVRIVRDFRPHVMTTYDENGGYPHPDHVMCHKVSVAAFEDAGDPDAYPDCGPAWQPLKLYYDVTFTRERVEVFHQAMLDLGMESPFGEWLDHWDERSEERRTPQVTTKVYCADHFDRRDAALMAHATQVDPEGWFFKVPLDAQRRLWPWEQFELARSMVDTQLPEDDLFAGVRVAVPAP
jgi:mycothiol S-conjugate amidase